VEQEPGPDPRRCRPAASARCTHLALQRAGRRILQPTGHEAIHALVSIRVDAERGHGLNVGSSLADDRIWRLGDGQDRRAT
jgi:hypothetical protein